MNAKSAQGDYEGVLVRHAGGYGNIHPWEMFGDPSLDTLIDMLKARDFSALLIRNAMHCAALDRESRQEHRSIFDGLDVPPSHASSSCSPSELRKYGIAGRKVVKVKVGNDLEAESQVLRAVHEEFPDLRWRLDFNHACHSLSVLESFLHALGEAFCSQTDFVEDPCLDIKEMLAHRDGLPMGVSWAVDRVLGNEAAFGHFRVLKPAVDDMEAELALVAGRDVQLVLTSYMDHPLGQSYAAWYAAKLQRDQVRLADCMGLKTHHLFEQNAFTRALGGDSSAWLAAEGSGFGFDEMLSAIPWDQV